MADNEFVILDDRFSHLVKNECSGRAPLPRLPLGGGTGLLPGRPLPRLERYSERPDAALGRDQRRHGRLSLPRGLHQPATRPIIRAASSVASTAGGASPAPSSTARSRRSSTSLRGSGSTVRTMSWCTRTARSGSPTPAYGIESDYEGHQAESELGGCYVFRVDPDTGDCRVVADDFVPPERARLLPRRVASLHRRHRGQSCAGRPAPHPGLGRRHRRHPLRRRHLRHLHRRRLRWLPARHRGPDLDERRATGSTATTRKGRCSAKFWCPNGSPTSSSVARSGTASSSAAPAPCTPSCLPVNGAKRV